jgi:hypothetical protein
VLKQQERILENKIPKLLYHYKQRQKMTGKSGKNMEGTGVIVISRRHHQLHPRCSS